MNVLFKRADGTFVIEHPVTGFPYHVLPGDPLSEGISAAEVAAAPLETLPPPPVLPSEPTKQDLQAQLADLAAKIQALP